MSQSWDAFVPPPAVWDECFRILKPGGHLLSFAGTRTVDLMGLSIRLAGFDIRDSLAWLYGSGFPKGQDIGARIDKAAGATREVIGRRVHPTLTNQPKVKSSAFNVPSLTSDQSMESWDLTAPATDEAKKWSGWSNALKPAFEPILMAQKPFTGPLYRNVMAEGVGGLNIAATRIAGEPVPINRLEKWSGFGGEVRPDYEQTMNNAGRYPSNVFLDEDQAEALDEQTGPTSTTGFRSQRSKDATVAGTTWGTDNHRSIEYPGETGGASRFFYVAKPAKSEKPIGANGARHPTVKPLALMRQLARLITPADGTIIDPFAGSGTTVEAAMLEGFQVLGIERGAEHLELIDLRMVRSAHG
jgi:site-specific DNA-methyltransferase (adenine-specific)